MFTDVVERYFVVAVSLLEVGDTSLAIVMLDATMDEAARFSSCSTDCARVARRVAQVYAQFQIYDKALSQYKRALSIFLFHGTACAIEAALALMDLAELCLILSRPRGAKLYLHRAAKHLQDANAHQEFLDRFYRLSIEIASIKIPSVRKTTTRRRKARP